MKRGFFLLIMFCGLSIACEDPEVENIPEDKLVKILADLVIADEIIIKYSDEEREEYRNYLKKQILEIHKVEETVFDSIFVAIQEDLLRYFNMQAEVEEYLKELSNKR